MKNEKGFTLIELLVVIGIIGLLSTLAVVSLSSARLKARDAKRMAELKGIQSAIEMYITESATGVAPAKPANWTALSTVLAAYFPAGVPQDPVTTRPICYCVDGGTTPTPKYLIAIALEQNVDIPGDIDTASSYTAGVGGECRCAQGAALDIEPTALNCADGNGGTLHTTLTSSVMCLGIP